MLKVLNKPYPCNKEIKDNLIISLLVGTFVFVFLFLFEPFNSLMNYNLKVITGYSLITFSISFSIAALLPRLFPKYFSDGNWTVGKEILHLGFIVFTIGVTNFFYSAPFIIQNGKGIYTLYNFFLSITITFTIGFMPIIIVVLYNQTRLLKKYINESEKLNNEKRIKNAEQKQIVLNGEGKNEQLRLNDNEILFIKSDNNYCEFHVLNSNEIQKELLRTTLTSLEEHLANFDSFIRVHRSYIVNSNNIDKVSGTAQGYKIHFNGIETAVPVSRNKSEYFKEYFSK